MKENGEQEACALLLPILIPGPDRPERIFFTYCWGACGF